MVRVVYPPNPAYPLCRCGVPLPLHREHEPCPDIERVAGDAESSSRLPSSSPVARWASRLGARSARLGTHAWLQTRTNSFRGEGGRGAQSID